MKRARIATRAFPTEYYTLLGLPLFTADLKEIKAAHRRVVKMVHPDVLGAQSAELQGIVTEAYNTLTDPELRYEYDKKLKRAKPTLNESRWAEEAPPGVKGLFVDETRCQACGSCVEIASSTFMVHEDPVRDGKTHVTIQYGDGPEIIAAAIRGCPHQAIRLVSREDLPLYEYAMMRSAKLRKRYGDNDRENAPGPMELFQDLKIDELIAMDLEKAKAEELDPMADSKVAAELADRAALIYQAALKVPHDTREKLWPDVVKADKAVEDLSEFERWNTFSKVSDVTRANTYGMRRAEMKSEVFNAYDEDGDGFLYGTELRKFAERFGFSGNELDWLTEYNMMCTQYECDMIEGMTKKAFSRMVDDEQGCYLTDEELWEILSESNRLPRARS